MSEHRIGFSGTVGFAESVDPLLVSGAFVLAGSPAWTLPSDGEAVGLVVDRRPDRTLVDEAAAAVRERAPAAVVGIGDGALLDATKLAAHLGGHTGPIVLVPCGAEPWRAFAPFAVVDDGAARPTVGDTTGGRAHVGIVDALLLELDARTVAVAAIDTAVHAVESLLSLRREPYAEVLAITALQLVAAGFEDAQSPAADPDACLRARVRLVIAAGLAVEAFMTTNLGLAHAIASPLGTELGVTHDTLNGILGACAVDFWSASPGVALAAHGLGVAPRAGDVVAELERYLARAELPPTLRALGVPWESIEAVLPAAHRSSALKGREDLTEGVLRAFARTAWAGDEEAAA
jgi:alcohol dehydrogenase class IV